MTHDELLAALKSATVPSRSLDRDIAMHIETRPCKPFVGPLAFDAHKVMYFVYGLRGDDDRAAKTAPQFTSSIDDALTLVPCDWKAAIWSDGQARVYRENTLGEIFIDYAKHGAATPAIALCIAALKARAAHPAETEHSAAPNPNSPTPTTAEEATKGTEPG